MEEIENLDLENLYKQELKNKLNVEELFQLPEFLEVQPSNILNLDKWRKKI